MSVLGSENLMFDRILNPIEGPFSKLILVKCYLMFLLSHSVIFKLKNVVVNLLGKRNGISLHGKAARKK